MSTYIYYMIKFKPYLCFLGYISSSDEPPTKKLKLSAAASNTNKNPHFQWAPS